MRQGLQKIHFKRPERDVSDTALVRDMASAANNLLNSNWKQTSASVSQQVHVKPRDPTQLFGSFVSTNYAL